MMPGAAGEVAVPAVRAAADQDGRRRWPADPRAGTRAACRRP